MSHFETYFEHCELVQQQVENLHKWRIVEKGSSIVVVSGSLELPKKLADGRLSCKFSFPMSL